MKYEIPNNMSMNVFGPCELLWEYDGSNYSNSPDGSCTIPIDTSCFSLFVVCVHDAKYDKKNSFIMVNDPTSPYVYVVNVFKTYIDGNLRRVTITENGLIFSPLYYGHTLDSDNDDTLCIPYQIYGIR